MSIHAHAPLRLTDLQREQVREKIEARERADAVQHVMDGGDLDRGRVSRMEFIATGAIVVDAEDIDVLLCDGDSAFRVRQHIDEQVAKLTETWLDTYRGQAWLEQKVADCLEDELEYELELVKLIHQVREESRQAAASGICVGCKAPFSSENTHTAAGWKETQISGLCEDCFDAACADLDPESEEGGKR